MIVLGIHIGHESSAALIIDGKVVTDVAEERFKRIKHYNGLPIKSIEYCLKSQNISMNDIDIIAIPDKQLIPDFSFLLDSGLPINHPSKIRSLLEIAPRYQEKHLGCHHYI